MFSNNQNFSEKWDLQRNMLVSWIEKKTRRRDARIGQQNFLRIDFSFLMDNDYRTCHLQR